MFKDKNTPERLDEDYAAMGDDGQVQAGALPGHVVLDSIGQGMGICCLQVLLKHPKHNRGFTYLLTCLRSFIHSLQVTFQACNVDEARFLYDQLAVMCPLMVL